MKLPGDPSGGLFQVDMKPLLDFPPGLATQTICIGMVFARPVPDSVSIGAESQSPSLDP